MNRYCKLFLFTTLLMVTLNIYAQPYAPSANAIRAIHWHPNGTMLAQAKQDGTFNVIDTGIGTIVFTYNNGDSPASAVRWNDDGNKLVVGIGLNILLFDFTTSFSQPTLLSTLSGNAGEIMSFAWNPTNSTEFASISVLGPNQLKIWDISGSNPNQILSADVPQSIYISWTCSNSSLVAGAGAGIRVVDTLTGSLTQSYGESLVNVGITAIQCTPNGNRIAIGTVFGDIHVFDISTGNATEIDSLSTSQWVTAIDWFRDNRTLATVGLDGTLSVWDTDTGQVLDTVEASVSLYSVNWNPISDELAYSGEDSTFEVITPNLTSNINNITSLTLINADTDTDIRTLSTSSTETIDIASNDISIRADTDPATVGSVVFTVDSNVVATDNSAPYTIQVENIALGQHTVVATPYSGADGIGNMGTPITVQINIVDSSD